MKKTILKCNGSAKSWSSGLFYIITLFVLTVGMTLSTVHKAEAASCTLGCHNANISLNENCEARINANMFLDGNGASCPGAANFVLTIRNGMGGPIIAQSGSLATGAMIFQWTTASAWLNRTVVVEVRDGTSGNMCWATALVEDKLPPVITSCSDVTVNCWESILWSPVFTEACSAPATVHNIDVSSRPGNCTTEPGILRVITRVYYATDAANNASLPCTLRVFVRAATLADITCSGDVTVDCGSYPVGTNPDPSVTGVPSIITAGGTYPLWVPGATNLACNIAVDYTDNLLQLTCGRERKIMRTWRINIWNCGVDQMTNCNQLITVRDISAPVIVCPQNLTLSTGSFTCTAPFTVPFPTVTDNCGTIKVDVIYPGGVKTNLGASGWPIAIPAGNNTITYRAYDDCGNSSECIFTVYVQDLTRPVPVCVRNTVVGLNEQGYGRINAADIDNGSWDNCSVVSYSIRKMNPDACQADQHLPSSNRNYLTFCCAEAGTSVICILTVRDAQGNTNECMVTVDVQDKILPIVTGLPDLTVDCRYPFENIGGTYNEFGTIRLPGSTRRTIYTWEETPVLNTTTGLYEIQRVQRNWGLDGYVQNGCINTVDAPTVTTNLVCGSGLITRTFIIRNASNTTTSTTQRILVASRNAFFGYDAGVMNNSITGAANVTNIFNADRDRDVWEDPCKFYYISNPPLLPLTPGPYMQVKWKDGKHDIYWPGDITLINPCQSTPASCTNPTRGARPQDTCALPFWAKKPVISGDDRCSQILLSYEDEEFRMPSGTANGCKKILRHWKVIDWCRRFCAPTPAGIYYVDGSAGYASWRYTQEIVIMNTIPPVVTCTDITLTANTNCTSTDVNLTATATDDCTDPAEFSWQWSLDMNNDGVFDMFGIGSDFTRNLTVGRHRVFWSVEDGCGNRATKECFVLVIEDKKPTPVCKTLVVELMPSTGTVTIPATNFNDGSFDNCTPANKLRFVISRDLPTNSTVGSLPTSITFNGSDFCCSGGRMIVNAANQTVLSPTFREVYVIVFDENGNWDFCRTGVMVQNNMGASIPACNPTNGACGTLLGRAIVGGSIQTENGRSVELVDISLDGANSQVQTNQSGGFEFPAMNTGGAYNVVPQKMLLPRNGVSTTDILLIQKHILGSERLNNPYKMIAADINKSGDITSGDLTELRKLVLGKIENFTRNNSWRFVDKNYVFTTNNPPSETFPEMYNISELRSNMTNIAFVGVKVGDVNNTSQPSQLYANEERSGNAYKLNINEVEFAAGSIVKIPVLAETDGELNALQLSFGFDNTKLIFEGYQGESLKLTDENMSFLQVNQGLLSTSWNANGNNLVKKGETLFVLTFKAIGNGKFSESLFVSHEGILAEAVNENNSVRKVDLSVINNGSIVEQKFDLFQNVPNPWNQTTAISFNLPQASYASIKIYDVSGKLLKSVNGQFAKGFNKIEVNRDEISSSGVLYYELSTQYGTIARKMIVMNK